MSVSSRVRGKGDRDLEFLWQDGERVFCRERRVDANGNASCVLIVTPAAEHPAPSTLDRLVHEYALKDELDGAWALRPLALIHERGRTMLVLEDPASEPLDRLLGAPMELGRFFHLATAVVATLMQLHRRGLIHKDLKPANILVNLTSGEVRFTGFGIASRLPRERQALEPPETVAGTLAYMAPEQTGRMNRSIDSRSDLYALGVTLYQMLTGALPFIASDPIEWAHCHIARQPVPPAERVKELPGVVSAIIMKLLAKSAEARYQTAAGLGGDLQRCLVAWEARRCIEHFPLGQDDKLDRLLIPEKLYGREREIEALLGSFARVANSGTPELVLISGYSGIGKSALVQELNNALVSRGGLFASGKADQHKRDIPYAALAQAFQSLIRHLLAMSDADLTLWRDALCEALDPLGRLIVDLVPELQLIIGNQPVVPDVPPQESQARFQLVFRRFIGVFARRGHPLALFLDDLQWLDIATLDLLEDLLTRSDLRNLLLIGAYRYNEVGATHPLTQRLDAIRHAEARVQKIRLAPLTRDHAEQLMADSLRCDPARTASLAQLVHEKTGGNPFFLIQFLYTLAEEDLLVFDHDKAQWSWNFGRIHAKGYTENVADLMVAKLSALPDEAQKALMGLAFLGNSAEVAVLSLVLGAPEQQIHMDLREAARLELIERIDSSYKFVHDRIQEAAYGLGPAEGKPALHLRIGMALAGCISPDESSEKLYLVANQLNRGVTAVTSKLERERIIAVNLSAGQRARTAAAYDAAIVYLDAARKMLGNEAHPRSSPTAFAVALLRAECEFLVGHLDVGESQLLLLSQNCPNVLAGAEVTRLRTNLHTMRGQVERGIDVCLEFLRQVGINWCAHPTDGEVDEEGHRVRKMAEELSDDQLHALPPMTDASHRATMEVLADLVTPALLTDINLSNIVILAAVRLTLQHGIYEGSCYPLACAFSVLNARYADPELGFRLARFGVSLADRWPQLRLSGRTFMVFGQFVTPWVRPIRSGQVFISRALKTALATGDLTWAAYSHHAGISLRLFSGDPLEEIRKDAEQGLAFAEALGFDILGANMALQAASTLSLIGRNENDFDLSEPTAPLESKSLQSACYDHIARIQINVLAGRHDAALALAERGDTFFRSVRAYVEMVEYRFYAALAHAAAYDASVPERGELHASSLRHHHHELTIRCRHNPANFADRLALLAAEIARIEGRLLDAQQLYDQAIRLAHANGFVHNEALANETAARFYAARGFEKIADTYLRDARDCYLQWGAEGKVRQLDNLYPYLRFGKSTPDAMSTIETSVEHLDLAAVVKLSQAISGEIVLEKLLDTVMRTAIEHAGAERGLLILPRNGEYRAEAEATTGSDAVTVSLRQTKITAADLPESVLRYVVRTKESVILHNASDESPFSADEYIHRHQARSILCHPLLKQTRLVGVLYLENSLGRGVFTPERMAVLALLASEAAISLENARLYADLQEREAKIRRVQAELAHANRLAAMGQLSASIAHEINQPIGAGITYANAALSWLRTQPPNWEEVRQALGFIVQSGVRAGEVVDRIRALVKKAPPQKDRVDINEAILEVLALVRGEIAKNDVSTKTELAEDLPPVWADRVQLQQVILNLFLNAIEAMTEMDDRSRELLISTERTHLDAVLVAVRDSGPGFPPESAEQIFESFYTTKPGGLGMGLSICRSIVEDHEGRLWATTSPHRGAVFQFTLHTSPPGE